MTSHSALSNESAYNMAHKFVGKAIIFNQVNFLRHDVNTRNGSDKDAEELKEVLEKIGFKVTVYRDLCTEAINEKLEKVANEDHTDNSCIWITMLTHGFHNGLLHTYDRFLFVDDLWANFTPQRCRTLIEKPKLFFIQACRGDNIDNGVIYKRDASLEVLSHCKPVSFSEVDFVVPPMADFLFMFSSAAGHKSFRDSFTGSWFIQELIEQLRKNPYEDFMYILTTINRNIAFSMQATTPRKPNVDGAKQMPVIKSMLTKSLRFIEQKNDSS